MILGVQVVCYKNGQVSCPGAAAKDCIYSTIYGTFKDTTQNKIKSSAL